MSTRLLRLDAIPLSTDAGLLALRVGAGLSLLLKHGTEKVAHFSTMAAHFPDPLHIGSATTLAFAMVSDAICSVLIMLGLATRWACLIAFVNIFAAWALAHHFVFFGRSGGHGELIVLYLVALLAVFIAGPGRFSLDSRLQGK